MTTYDLTSSTPSKLVAEDVLNCPYSGTYKTITLPKGVYKLECWGARGGKGGDGSGNAVTGSISYGCGGYSVGTVTLTSNTTIYLYTGGVGGDTTGKTSTGCSGGFNGGGKGGNVLTTSSATNGSGGGGASDIRIGTDSLYARVIVAGGGGGASWSSSSTTTHHGGHGGGVAGTGGVNGSGGTTVATGGTLTSGGSGSKLGSNAQGASGSFGTGGNGSANDSNNINSGAGGGGGWYGGGAGGTAASGNQAHAGGGSGYIYTSSTASNYPSGCLLTSDFYLTNAQTIAGNDSMPNPSGGTETGHSDNGYIRITVLSVGGSLPLKTRIADSIKEVSAGYIKLSGEWKAIASAYTKINGEWKSS